MKDKIKIAVVLNYPESAGGGFTHTINFCEDLYNNNNDKLIKFNFYCQDNASSKYLDKLNIEHNVVKYTFFRKLKTKMMTFFVNNKILKLFGFSYLEKFMLSQKIDLIIFTHPATESVLLRKINFIYTLWDTCHVDHPEFPEIKYNNEFTSRENIYKLSCSTATAVLVESNVTKKIISERYNINGNKIHKINLYFNKFENIQEGPSTTIKDIIKKDYYFYPAQFWSHKNHIYILKSLKILKEKYNKKNNVIFTGTDMGNKKFITKSIEKLGLTEQVNVLNFVSNSDLYHLYKNSKALIMPTYFGPSNIPPLEAINLNIPVIYSDDDSMDEQLGDAAFKVNLSDEMTLVKTILDIQSNYSIVQDKLIKYPLIKKNFDKIDNVKVVIDIINQFKKKWQSWE